MYNLKTKEDKIYYFKNISQRYKAWNKDDLRVNILEFLKITEQDIKINLENKTKIELQNIYKNLLSNYGVKKDKKIQNIIKYIEERENCDIWDFKDIKIILAGDKYSHKPVYRFEKSLFETTPNIYYDRYFGLGCDEEDKSYEYICIEYIHNKEIKNKSQIANRIQYIKQSGYKFKEYSTVDNTLSITFE